MTAKSLLLGAAALQLARPSVAEPRRMFVPRQPSSSVPITINSDWGRRCYCAFTASTSTSSPPCPLPGRRMSSALSATPVGGKAETLFPSDDSDYKQQQQQHDISVSITSSQRTAAVAAVVPDMADKDDSNAFRFSEVFHPTQTRVRLGNDLVVADPFDVIADWVSDKFHEQSLQQQQSESKSSNNNEDGHSSDNNTMMMMESFSPGSVLDAIARASSTYTPLSYQIRTVVRTVLPSIVAAIIATSVYPSMAQWLIHLPDTSTPLDTTDILYNDQVLTVLSNDLSQYVQNILTTCALLFGMLVGQTYYFMYQQQELVFYALFAEVTEAKSLLEQISLMTYGREGLYPSLLSRMDDYVQNDLKLLSVKDPIAVTSKLPKDDPLESILYATSVGLPGVVYETVKSLRQARADRCGALQRKLPALHVYCLRLLGVIVLSTFPVCGSGSMAIAPNVLVLQAYMFGILAFALTLVLNVVEELRNSRKMGAYNVDGILKVMVSGLEQELEERLEGKFSGVGVSPSLPARVDDAGWADDGDVGQSIVDLRRDIDNSRLVGISDGTIAGSVSNNNDSGDSKNDLPDSRRRRVKNWLQRKVLRRQ